MDVAPEDFELPDHADEDEAAAIAAAISAHLADLDGAEGSAGTASEGWQGRRWWFAGRVAAVFDRPTRVSDGAPEDPWTASGRRDRL